MGITLKQVVVTGASGLVGRNICKRLSASGMYQIYAVGSNLESLSSMYADVENVSCINSEQLFNRQIDVCDVDYLIHCAFTRNNAPNQVASAMEYAKKVFELFAGSANTSILNISTRSVYQEPEIGTFNTEKSPIVPSGAIGIGKYASELMLQLICSQTNQKYSNLRLSSVNEEKTENTMVRPMNVFVDRVIAGEPIKVVGGMQVMSYISPSDIADAIFSLMLIPSDTWAPVYNIGTGNIGTATLLEIATMVRDIGKEHYNLPSVDIIVEKKDVVMSAGLDISLITGATGWKPKLGLSDMVHALYKMKLAM